MRVFNALMPAYTDTAAYVSSEVFNEIGLLMTGEEQHAVIDSMRSEIASDIAVKGIFNQAETIEQLIGLLLDRASYEIRRAAGKGMYANAGDNVRFARVPTGKETCHFCIMLASRGFVYRSEESAGGHYHANCDCVVIPSFGGKKAIIDGYTNTATINKYKRQYQEYEANKQKSTVVQSIEKDPNLLTTKQAARRYSQNELDFTRTDGRGWASDGLNIYRKGNVRYLVKDEADKFFKYSN